VNPLSQRWKWARIALIILPLLLLAAIGLWFCPPSASFPLANQVFCAVPRPRASGIQHPSSGSVLIVRTDSGRVFDEAQALLPDDSKPKLGESPAFVACISADWHEETVRVISQPNRREVSRITLKGEESLGYNAQDVDPPHGGPPVPLSVVTWLAKTLNFNVEGALLTGDTLGGYGPLVFSADGAVLATGGPDDEVILWDVASQERVLNLSGHTEPPRAGFFTAGNSRLLTIGFEGEAIEWNTATGAQERTFRAPNPAVFCHVSDIALDADGILAATGWSCLSDPTLAKKGSLGWAFAAPDSPLVLWNIGTGERVISPTVDVGDRPLLMSPLIVGDKVYNLGGGEGILLSHSLDTVEFSPDGMMLAGGHKDGVFLTDFSSGETKHLGEDVLGVQTLAFSPDSQLLAVMFGKPYASQVCTFDVKSGDRVNCLSLPMREGASIAFSPDGQFLAVSGAHGSERVVLWNPYTGQVACTLRGHRSWSMDVAMFGGTSLTPVWYGGVQRVAFSPDGTLLATGGGDGVVLLWNAQSGELAKPHPR